MGLIRITMKIMTVAVLLLTCLGLSSAVNEAFVGSFSTLAHGVQGQAYALSPSRLNLRAFSYDGQGPDAFIYVDTTSSSPNGNGMIIPDETGSTEVLKSYNNADIILTLPEGVNVWNIKWLSVWCRQFTVDFGHIIFPSNLESQVPKPLVIGQLSQLAHGVRSGDVTILDTKRFEIKNLHYDGQGPDAFFIVGSDSPDTNGKKLADEDGSNEKLKGYSGKTIVLILPEPLTMEDIDYLSIYCFQAQQDFGNVQIPNNLLVPTYHEMSRPGRNCESMHPRLNVAWTLEKGNIMLEMASVLKSGEYMSFGISGSDSRTSMFGAKAIVVHFDSQGRPIAEDYAMTAYSQCAGGQGACPVTQLGGDNLVQVISSSVRDGISKVQLSRPFWRGDKSDLFIAWAIGNFNSAANLVTKHSLRTQGNVMVNFGRTAQDNCQPLQAVVRPELAPWAPARLNLSPSTPIMVSMGPSGGERGYSAITGKPSWGIAYWVNQKLIPELIVKRGQKYTFVVEGGADPSNLATYHPFYLTTSTTGGRGSALEAGITPVETILPLTDVSTGRQVEKGVGRLCEWTAPSDVNPDNYDSMENFASRLTKQCTSGSAGRYTWTPGMDTPDLIYYQCYTHQNLGWKIHVTGTLPRMVSSATNVQERLPALLSIMTFAVASIVSKV